MILNHQVKTVICVFLNDLFSLYILLVDIDKDVVISAVIVPLAVVIILVLLLVVAIIGYGITRKSKKDEDRFDVHFLC